MAKWHSEGAWIRFKDANTLFELGVIENLTIVKEEGKAFPYIVKDQKGFTQGAADDINKALTLVDWIFGTPDEEDHYGVTMPFADEEQVLNQVLSPPNPSQEENLKDWHPANDDWHPTLEEVSGAYKDAVSKS